MRQSEGGANLNMPPPVIEELVKRGAKAGRTIVDEFDHAAWSQHVFDRYIFLVHLVHEGMSNVEDVFGGDVRFGQFLRAGAPRVNLYGRQNLEKWAEQAADATERIITSAAHCNVFVALDEDPQPQPVMRMATRT